MARYFLQSTTKPAQRYEILEKSSEGGKIKVKLKGSYAEGFDELIDKEWLTKYKYTIVKEEDHADAV